MKLFQSAPGFDMSARAASRTLSRWFPTPTFLYPHAAGIDISDSSVKWLLFNQERRVVSWGEEPLPAGVVVSGRVRDTAALAEVLKTVRAHLHGVRYAHAALPEEAAYVFGMSVPDGTEYDQALRMIEFEFEGRVPIPPSAAVYDFDIVLPRGGGRGEEIGVAVFPSDLAKSYCDAFTGAGITLLSLELEARSIARAVSDLSEKNRISLIVDFGRERTGFAVVKHGVPIFTSTVEVGGDAITRSIVEKMHVSEEQAVAIRNEEGLVSGMAASPGAATAASSAAALADEIARHYHYWDTRRDERGERMTPVGNVILVGGSSNLRGLTDFISSRVQAATELGDVWRNVFTYDDYIPPIDRRRSLQYATAVGLAMRSLL